VERNNFSAKAVHYEVLYCCNRQHLMTLPATRPSGNINQCRDSNHATTKAFRSCWKTPQAY